MKHAMFDVDGTLVQSGEIDNACYLSAIEDVTGISLNDNWSMYPHATDRGILMTFIEKQAPWLNLMTLEIQVKAAYIQNIKEYLKHSKFQPVDGAIEFLSRLNADNRITVSIATGGWREPALLKLESAGFDTTTLAISTSNEHYSRTEIMKLAAKRASEMKPVSFTYFGDAEWDVKACYELDVNLVVIGNRTQHFQRLPDFTNYNKAVDFILSGKS